MRTPPVPTLAEMAESCAHNARVAKGQLEHALSRRRLTGFQGPEDKPNPDWVKANHDVSKHESELKQWSEYAAHYQRRATREGGGTVPLTLRFAPGREIVPVAPPEPQVDRRLPREDDAWDDEKLAEELR